MTTTEAELLAEHAACTAHSMDRAMRLLGDVWTLRIIYTLLADTKRFGELLEALGNVSPKTLSHRLKRLEETGFVQRQAYAEIPPRVTYHLTEQGLALADILEAIRQFAERYLADAEPGVPDATLDRSPCE